jgi:hypothetical protein
MYYLQVAMITTSVVMPCIAALAVTARFQARRVKRMQFGADDWTILLALVRIFKSISQRSFRI